MKKTKSDCGCEGAALYMAMIEGLIDRYDRALERAHARIESLLNERVKRKAVKK